MNIYITPILFLLLEMASFSVAGGENLKYVNPFIGTAPSPQPSNWDGHGRTYPGAVAPFGFIQLSPETRISPVPGYDYRDSVIYFFSCFGHHSGYPNGSAGYGKILPVEHSSSFQINCHSRPFLHSTEVAEPGYYKVVFSDNGTTAETTVSTRSGMFRFSFEQDTKPAIFIGDLGALEMVSATTLHGNSRNVWIEFDVAWEKVEKTRGGYIFSFDDVKNNKLQIKLSSSSVGFENAKANLDAEIPSWNFDVLRNETQKAWSKELEVFEIEDQSVYNKVKFYTALYHSLLFPWIVSDTDGSYRGRDGEIYESKGANQYDGFSTWDTFRSLHPLFCIITPYRQTDMIVSMLEIYRQTGKLPSDPMTGYHSVPVIIDSYFKNITGFDTSLAFEAMKDILLTGQKKAEDFDAYIRHGFVPNTFPESVTRTVEYAYDDWVLAQFSKEMGQTQDEQYLLQRSLNYRNLFDPCQLFLVPRGENGFTVSTNNVGYKEGDKWNYSLFVPHNIRDMVNLKGGPCAFSRHLDSALVNDFILFDNEPNFHIPYLFNFAKCPMKTQEWVSEIRESQFSVDPNGLPGNDDLGSMSSWFVFNAMGFFPVCPGVPEYQIGTPLFEKLIIHQPNGSDFVIQSEKAAPGNIYIQSLRLNDQEYNHSWFFHDAILAGGRFLFELSASPSEWAVVDDSVAFSITQKDVDISVDSIWSVSQKLKPHEFFPVYVVLKNEGSSGVQKVRVYEAGRELASKNIYLEEGDVVQDSVFCRLYTSGDHRLTVKGSSENINVRVTDTQINAFLYSGLSVKPLIKMTDVQYLQFSVKNIGNFSNRETFDVVLNDRTIQKESVELAPGESRLFSLEVDGFKLGVNIVGVDRLSERFKAYDANENATLVDLRFSKVENGVIQDQSGFENNAIPIIFNDHMSEGVSDSSYTEIINSASLSSLNDELSIMVWVKPLKVEDQFASIITHGDHTVIQILNNQTIEFFTGGWGRGACNVAVTPNFFDQWHHLAGVSDGLSLRFYIDGKLKGMVQLDSYSRLSADGSWTVGSNTEFPNQRMFKGEMDDIKIYGVALSEVEINEIIMNAKDNYLKRR